MTTAGSGAWSNLAELPLTIESYEFERLSRQFSYGHERVTTRIRLRGVAADLLARAERVLVDAGFTVEKYAREGDPAQTIIDVAADAKAELIVIGAHGNTGMRRFMLGGVAGKLAHHAPKSLMIVRED